MRKAIIFLFLTLLLVGSASAAYMQDNEIWISNGQTETMQSIYTSISNNSVISYAGGVYTLHKNISSNFSQYYYGNLEIHNTTVVVDNSDGVNYRTVSIHGNLSIENSVIRGDEWSLQQRVPKFRTYQYNIENNQFINGQLAICPMTAARGYLAPHTPGIVQNNIFSNWTNVIATSDGSRVFCSDMNSSDYATIQNNTFRNIIINGYAGNPGNAIMFFQNANHATIRNNVMENTTVSPFGNYASMLGWVGSGQDSVIDGLNIDSGESAFAVGWKEWNDITLNNITINCNSTNGLYLYFSDMYTYTSDKAMYLNHFAINGTEYGIGAYAGTDMELYAFDGKISNVTTVYKIPLSTESYNTNLHYYLMNVNATDYTNEYSWLPYPSNNTTIRKYAMIDVYTADSENIPVKCIITTNGTSGTMRYSDWSNASSYTTSSDGHAAEYPSLLYKTKMYASDENYSYVLSATTHYSKMNTLQEITNESVTTSTFGNVSISPTDGDYWNNIDSPARIYNITSSYEYAPIWMEAA